MTWWTPELTIFSGRVVAMWSKREDDVKVTLLGSWMSCLKLNSSNRSQIWRESFWMGWSAFFLVRSQFVSPKRNISLPSLSRKEKTRSNFWKVLTGSLEDLYQTKTKNDLLFTGTISIQISSRLSMGIPNVNRDPATSCWALKSLFAVTSYGC